MRRITLPSQPIGPGDTVTVDAGLSVENDTGATAVLTGVLWAPVFEWDDDELDYWRRVMRGQAGFNGFPQQLVKLMEVSDAANLKRLSFAFPEAVAAIEETRR